MSKVNIFSKDLNRMSREPIGGLSIEPIRQQVIDYLQGKRTVRVDYRKIRADTRMMSPLAKRHLKLLR